MNIPDKLTTSLSLLLLSGAVQAAELTVYTYDSFVSEWGPGPKLEEAFEKQCDCDLKFIAAEDGVSILNRLRIEKDKAKADVVLGLDDALLEETRATGLIAEHGIKLDGLKPELSWTDKDFVPFDYGYFAFIYDSSKISEPVSSLKALVDSEASVIYQDPRTSTPGQGLMLWMNAVYGDDTTAAWQQLAKHTVTVTKGWWEAYSMFLEGGSDYVLSYTTSPAYHRITEEKDQYKAAAFKEGHVAQTEVAARLTSSQQPELAQQFLEFLVSAEAQQIIPVTNWMLPVVDVELPDVFSELVQPEKIGFSPAEIAEQRQAWLKDWRSAAAK
jgi:thiamine transport system substrate-binding protein